MGRREPAAGEAAELGRGSLTPAGDASPAPLPDYVEIDDAGGISAYDFSARNIDALLGTPALMIGEDVNRVRALENAMYNDMADPARPQSFVDIRVMASALREAVQLEHDRARLLGGAFDLEIAAIAAQRPELARQLENLGARADRIKLERLLTKAGVSIDLLSSRAMAKVRLQYDALSAMIDRAHKKARDAEAHAWRRQERRVRLRMLRKKAQDMNALDPFD